MTAEITLSSASKLLAGYKDLLRRTMNGPLVDSVRSEHSIGSAWGSQARNFHEIIGSSISIDSDDVVLWAASRPINVRYALVSSAWITLGRNDVACLTRFNDRGAAFSRDGFTLSGAFGFRLRYASLDQIESAIKLLSSDPSSRRAVCFIGLPGDLIEQSRDFPCASLVQFFLRSQLECVVYMRSQSLFSVFPYDLINFRYLQRYVAWRLGVDHGQLHFAFGSLHVYEEELERVQRFLEDETAGFGHAPSLRWQDLKLQFESWLSPEGEGSDLDGLIRSIEPQASKPG